MDALLPLPSEFEDDILELVERFYTDSAGPWQLPDHLLQSPAVRVYNKILQTDPFRECKKNHIWVETLYTPRSEFYCQNRPRLIAALVMSLREYLEVERLKKTTPQEMQWRTWEALWHLRAMLDLFLTLRGTRGTRGLSAEARSKTKGIREKVLNKAWGLVERATFWLTLADYASYTETTMNRIPPYSLFARMRAAFRAYGPCDPHYSQDAVDYGIASILIDFGIEPGSHQRVIERLRARENRAPQPEQD